MAFNAKTQNITEEVNVTADRCQGINLDFHLDSGSDQKRIWLPD